MPQIWLFLHKLGEYQTKAEKECTPSTQVLHKLLKIKNESYTNVKYEPLKQYMLAMKI